MEDTPERKMPDDAFTALIKRVQPKPIRIRKSKYVPHQGERERSRRLRQLESLSDTFE